MVQKQKLQLTLKSLIGNFPIVVDKSRSGNSYVHIGTGYGVGSGVVPGAEFLTFTNTVKNHAVRFSPSLTGYTLPRGGSYNATTELCIACWTLACLYLC